MEIFQRITAQMATVGLPLYAVSLTALPRADTPLILFLHWHGFRRAEGSRTLHPVPGSALQLNDRWQTLEEIDEAMLDAGWQLGAWDVARDECRPCSWAGASTGEALECQQAFGSYPGGGEGEALLIAEAPDRRALMELAAAKGYVRWLFRPVKGGLWQETARDDTLNAEGGRLPPCPVAPRAPTELAPGRKAARTVYRLGRIRRIILP